MMHDDAHGFSIWTLAFLRVWKPKVVPAICGLDPRPRLLGCWFAVAFRSSNSSRPQTCSGSLQFHVIPSPLPFSHPQFYAPSDQCTWCNPRASGCFSLSQGSNMFRPGAEYAKVDDLNVTCDEEHGNCLVEGDLRPDVFKWTMWGKRFQCQLEKKVKKAVESLVWQKDEHKIEWRFQFCASPWCLLFCFPLPGLDGNDIMILSTQRPVILLIYHLHIPERSSFVSSCWPCAKAMRQTQWRMWRHQWVAIAGKKALFHHNVLKLLFSMYPALLASGWVPDLEEWFRALAQPSFDHLMTAKSTDAILAGPSHIPRVANHGLVLIDINIYVYIYIYFLYDMIWYTTHTYIYIYNLYGIPSQFEFVMSFPSFHMTFIWQPLPARRCGQCGRANPLRSPGKKMIAWCPHAKWEPSWTLRWII